MSSSIEINKYRVIHNKKNINFKTIQFNTLDEMNLKDIIASINYRLFFKGIDFEKKPKS